MDPNPQVSVVTAAAKRSKVVALQDWQLEDGSPLCVLCTEVDAEACARELGVLPGERPQLGVAEKATQDEMVLAAEKIAMHSVFFIEAGVRLIAADGTQFPAFYFDDTALHYALSFDGRKLSENDFLVLGTTVMRMSGYLGGAARATFLRRERDRLGHGSGVDSLLPMVQHNAGASVQ